MTSTTAWKLNAVVASALLLAAPQSGQAADPDDIEEKRAAFRAALPAAERGNWQAAEQYEHLLRSYVLWPDLRAAYLKSRLKDIEHAEVRSFLDRYGMQKPARELRYEFALHLADEGHLQEYLEIYRQYFADLDIARLDCLALDAEIQAGGKDEIVERGTELWLTGVSQADECDAVFSHLQAIGALTDEHIAKRFALAVGARQFSLARYLSGSLEAEYRLEANHWIAAQNDATHFLSAHGDRPDSDVGREQLIYALERVAFVDPLLAEKLWAGISDQYPFSALQQDFIGRHIALWAARQHLPVASDMLDRLSPQATDQEVLSWTIRTGLRHDAWDDVLRAIAAMPDNEQQTEEWQYWEAIALKNSGQQDPATAKLERLSGTRSYYGFLAADASGAAYAFADNRLLADDAILLELAKNPALIRARELFYVGLEGRGRSEWDAALKMLDTTAQTQAAILAHRWGWHSRAIASASAVGQYDDLTLRYPLPWRDDFAQFSKAANIDDSWAYGIARSESLFMRDIRSGAGAIGVMQLLPETGKHIAREFNYPYAGRATLTDTSSNIRLGTKYLQKMYKRFDDNPVLATAAYNAGPLRVAKWLPDAEQIDARVWIENIPYNETRSYVRRVLTADAIFHWRLTGEIKRISSVLSAIDPVAESVAGSH